MTVTDIRYGIIGSGMMGQEHIRNIALLDGARVAAVADSDPDMREQARALAGGECAAFETDHALLEAGLCDAFVLATPNHLHQSMLMTLIDAGKPILVEKPLALTADGCRQIMARAERVRTPIWVAMEYRYMPPIARLIAERRAGTAGAIKMISIREHRFPFLAKVGHWNRFAETSGGTLVEKCCHFFDLMRLIAEADPVRVYASGAQDVNFLDERYDGRQPDVIDNAFVIVDFANGVRSMLDLCMFAEGSRWQETVTATGDRARLDAYVPGPARFAPDGAAHRAAFAVSDRTTKAVETETVDVDDTILAAGDHHGSTYFQHQKFLAMVRDGGMPDVDLTAGLWAVAVGEAAEASIRTGQAVPVDPATMLRQVV